MKQWSMKLIGGALLCSLLLSGCANKPAQDSIEDNAAQTQEEQMQDEQAQQTETVTPVASHILTIEMQDYGTIEAELYENVAPITVANFVSLAESGFYDGLTFHRIISGFMMQGGDPLGNGTGGAEETIKGEFAANGVQNDLSHVRGVLSMARSSANDSASSQFFIMHADSTHLDGEYAAFGMVTSGMEVVDAICESTPVEDGNGTVLAENQPVITSMQVTAVATAE